MTAMGYGNSAFWDQVGQVEPILHMGMPSIVSKHVFSRKCLSRHQSGLVAAKLIMSFHSSSRFLPFIFTDRCTLCTINGAGGKYQKNVKTETRMTLRPIQFSCSSPTSLPPIPSMTAKHIRIPLSESGWFELKLHMGSPVFFRNVLSRSPCRGTNLGLLLRSSSSCLVIEQ